VEIEERGRAVEVRAWSEWRQPAAAWVCAPWRYAHRDRTPAWPE